MITTKDIKRIQAHTTEFPIERSIMKLDPEEWLKWGDVIEAIGAWGGPERQHFDDAIKRIYKAQEKRLQGELNENLSDSGAGD